jgi:hypothetical protein
MKTLIKSLMLATALTFLGPVVGHAASVCTTASEDAFLGDAVAKNNAKVFKANEKAMTVLVGAINQARADAGQEPFLVDTLMIGVFSYQGAMYVGTVMFKDHCVVRDTVKVFTLAQWVEALTQYNLSIEDFVQLRGA